MFKIGTPISLNSDGWPVVAEEGDVIFGIVAGPPNELLGKLNVSLQDRPDQTVELFYQNNAPPVRAKTKRSLASIHAKYTNDKIAKKTLPKETI